MFLPGSCSEDEWWGIAQDQLAEGKTAAQAGEGCARTAALGLEIGPKSELSTRRARRNAQQLRR